MPDGSDTVSTWLTRSEQLLAVLVLCATATSSWRIARAHRGATLSGRLARLTEALGRVGRHDARRTATLHAATVRNLLGLGTALPSLARLAPLWGACLCLHAFARDSPMDPSCTPLWVSHVTPEAVPRVLFHLAFGVGLAVAAAAAHAVLAQLARHVVQRRFTMVTRFSDATRRRHHDLPSTGHCVRVAAIACLLPTLGYVSVHQRLTPHAAVEADLGGCAPSATSLRLTRDGRARSFSPREDLLADVGARQHYERLVPIDAREIRVRLDDGVRYDELIRVVDHLRAEPGRRVCIEVED